MAPDVEIRRARAGDAAAISHLNNTFADEGQRPLDEVSRAA